MTIIYLSLSLLTSSSDTQPKQNFGSTVLHSSKDLAVSPLVFPQELTPKGARFFQIKASLLAPRASLRTGVTRYLAPICIGNVRTFLLNKLRQLPNWLDKLHTQRSMLNIIA